MADQITLKDFNTSYVTVQLTFSRLSGVPITHFNTSYVTVQQNHVRQILHISRHFNTSYVTVQLCLLTSTVIFKSISIHPMLRFNFPWASSYMCYTIFQYILCYGSTGYTQKNLKEN